MDNLNEYATLNLNKTINKNITLDLKTLTRAIIMANMFHGGNLSALLTTLTSKEYLLYADKISQDDITNAEEIVLSLVNNRKNNQEFFTNSKASHTRRNSPSEKSKSKNIDTPSENTKNSIVETNTIEHISAPGVNNNLNLGNLDFNNLPEEVKNGLLAQLLKGTSPSAKTVDEISADDVKNKEPKGKTGSDPALIKKAIKAFDLDD